MIHPLFCTKPTPPAKKIEVQLRREINRRRYQPNTSIVFAIGGDGTLLKAIRDNISKVETYVGISAGHLGFLQTINADQIPELISALIAKTHTTLSAPLLTARRAETHATIGYAFNDISIERAGPRAAKFRLHIGGSPGNFVGDGVIFATPLGSTAYSLASGGPIIDSRLQNVFVITPNNPHVSAQYSSLQRPHVIHGERVVTVSLDNTQLIERPLQIALDGFSQPLSENVEILLSERRVMLVQLEPDGFHTRIEDKRLGRN